LSFFVQCFLRCLQRETHETLTNENPEHLARVLFMFFKSYEGQNHSLETLKSLRFDSILKIPFTVEHKDV